MTTLEALFSWVLTTTWQASVLAVLVLTAQALLGPRLNPRWRHALWLLVIARLLLPDLPESAFSLFRLAPAAPLNLPETISEPVIAIHPSLTNFAVPPQVTVPQPNFTFLYLALLWFSGALALLLLTWIVNHRFARHVARAPQITDPALLDLFAAAKTELRFRRPIRLVESAQVQSPAIMGLVSPTLLLPFNAREKFTPRELRFIFLHELAHLKRGDVAIQALIALLQIIHWFNPVLWYAFRRLRADREPATDALVLSRTGEADKEPYGLMLVKLLEHFNQRHALPTLVGILEDTDQFKRRFSLIARFTRGAYGWSLLGFLVLTLLAAVCLTKAKAQTPPSGNSAESAPPTHPPHNPALGQKLLALVQYPSTDKVGAGDADKVAQLLAQGADPNAKSGPAPALIWALNFGKDDAAVALIAKGADINATDGKMSAVELASFLYYCPKALDALLKKGAHLQPAGAPARNVLEEAFSAGPAAAGKMNYLRDRAWTDTDYQAWLQRQRKVIDLLAAAGVDLNGAPGTTPPLIRAIRAGHLDGARELLRLGAKVDVHDANGQTPQSTAQTWHPEFLPDLHAAETKAHEAGNVPAPAPTDQPKDIVATVNRHAITTTELDQQCQSIDHELQAKWSGDELKQKELDERKAILHALIDRWLVIDDFHAQGGLFPRAYTDARIDDIVRDQYGGDRAAFLQTLASRGQTIDRYREEMEDNAIVGYMRNKQVEQKVNDYYDAHLDLFPADEQLRVTFVEIKGSVPVPAGHTNDFAHETDPRAQMARDDQRKLEAGADPTSLPVTEGVDAKSFGHSIWITQDRFPGWWNSIRWDDVEKLKPGQTTGVFVLDGDYSEKDGPGQNYHYYNIVRLEERRPAKIAATPETAAQKKTLLQTERQRLQNNWLGGLRATAKIQILDPALAQDSPPNAAPLLPPHDDSSPSAPAAGSNATVADTANPPAAATAAAGADNAPAAPPAKKTADANQIEINLKLVEIDDGYYRANKDKVDAAIERADLAYFQNLRGVSLLSCPSVSTQPAQKAIIEIVREFPYPTEFDPSKRVPNRKVAMPGGGTETLTLLVPPTPREFATRDVGVSAVVTPTINDSTTLAPGKIVLLGRVTVTDFEGFVKSNMTGVGMPCFNTSESNFLEQVDNREMKGVWIPGLHAEQPPAADPHAPLYASTNPGASVKRMLLFVSASRVP